MPIDLRHRRAPDPTASSTPLRDRHRSRRTGGVRRRDRFGAWRRRSLARLPTGPLLVVLAGAVAVTSLRSGAADAGPGPGSAAPVVVATVALDPGAVVAPDDIEIRSVPLVALPADVTGEPDDVVGRQVTAPIFAGEAIPEGRLAPNGLVGIAAATPPGRSSFAVPADARLPPAVVGQRVDLYALAATVDPEPWGDRRSEAPDEPVGRIARGALVVSVDDQRVTVAVDPTEAPAVAGALIGSTVVLAVTGPDPDP